jgi:PAS domain S-box-containing protein
MRMTEEPERARRRGTDDGRGPDSAGDEATDHLPGITADLIRALVANSTDMIVRANLQGKILYVSPACRAMGYEPEDLVGRMGAELVHPDDLARFSANVAEVFAGEPIDRTVNREIRYRRKDGGWIWLEGNPQAIRDKAGHVVELFNVFRDVSERRRLRDAEVEQARFEKLAKEVAGVGYWRLDVQTRQFTWSDQMFMIYGLEPGDEPPLEAALALIHPDDRTDSDKRLRIALESGQGWTDALTRIIRPDGEVRYVEGRGICERENGAVSVVFGTMVDVTDKKRAEIAAVEANSERRVKEELFETAFFYAAIGKALVGLDGGFLKINPAFCTLVGYSAQEMLELDFQSITHPEDLDADLEFLGKLVAGEISSYQMDKRYIRADRTLVWVHLSVSMVADRDGRPKHFIAQVQDLTASKAAETALAQSEQRFRRLAVNASDMIAECTLEGVMTYLSPASLAITGFTPEELVGQAFSSLMNPDDALKVLEMCQAMFASKGVLAPSPVEFRTKHKSGHEVWLECKPTLTKDPVSGRFTGLTDVIRDITGRKALEAQLRQAQADAEAGAAVKGEFLANMSHELRTPLTSIVGFTRLAAEQVELQGLARTYVERVGEASRALLCTVNDILDFSKLEVGQVSFQPKPTSLAKISRATLELLMPQAEAKDLDLVLDCDLASDVVISLDPDRIRQILLNLVGNAVKFTDAGRVTLRTRYDQPSETLSIEVIDTGPGIPPDRHDRLFKRFSQVDGSLTRSHGGTGLGLAICKGLVEAMGGEIGADSRPGEGSRFWLMIPAPIADAQSVLIDGPNADPTTFTGVRVLVVDDHAANRELARLILAGIGAEVSEAADGEDAAQLAAEWPYDVILMDLRMPKLDGPGALQKIREGAGPNDATPILAFTADAEPQTAARLAALGFQGVIAKPLEPGTLIAAVARATAFEQDRQDQEQFDVA